MEDLFEVVAEAGRRLKRERVIEHGDDADEEGADLTSFIWLYRNGHAVAQVIIGPGPDGAREACYHSAILLRPHELYLVADTRMRSLATKGQERSAIDEELSAIQKGDFQRDWQRGRREDLSECLVVYRLPSIGPATTRLFPYLRRGKDLHWLEPMTADEGLTIAGAIPDHAAQGYAAAKVTWPKLYSTLRQAADQAGYDGVEESIDRACARMLSTKGVAAVTLFLGPENVTYVDGDEQ